MGKLLTELNKKCKRAKRFANGVNKFWWIRDRCLVAAKTKEKKHFCCASTKLLTWIESNEKMFFYSQNDKTWCKDWKRISFFSLLVAPFEGVEARRSRCCFFLCFQPFSIKNSRNICFHLQRIFTWVSRKGKNGLRIYSCCWCFFDVAKGSNMLIAANTHTSFSFF